MKNSKYNFKPFMKYPILTRKTVVTVFLLFAFFFSAHAQIFTEVNPGLWGPRYNRGEFDSTLYYPSGNGVPHDTASLFSVGFKGAFRIKKMAALYRDTTGHQTYTWDPASKTWSVIGGGASTDNLDSVLSRGGALSADRTVQGAGHQLIIRNTQALEFGSRGGSIDSSYFISFDTTIDMTTYYNGEVAEIGVQPHSFQFLNTNTQPNAHKGWVMTLIDSSDGFSDWAPATGSGGLFGHSDVLAIGDRAFNANSHAFHIYNLSDLTFSTPNGAATTLADSVNNGLIRFLTPNTYGAGTSGTPEIDLGNINGSTWFSLAADSNGVIETWSGITGSATIRLTAANSEFQSSSKFTLSAPNYFFDGSPTYLSSSDTTLSNVQLVGTDGEWHITDWASLKASLVPSLTSGKIFVGNVSNVAIAQTPSGDWTINNAGVAAISNNAVTFAKFQQLAANKLFGNPTGSTANGQAIGLGRGLWFTSGNLADSLNYLSDFINDIGAGGGGTVDSTKFMRTGTITELQNFYHSELTANDSFNVTTGAYVTSTTTAITDYVPVPGSTSVTISVPNGYGNVTIYGWTYDSTFTAISEIRSHSLISTGLSTYTFTTASNARFLSVYVKYAGRDFAKAIQIKSTNTVTYKSPITPEQFASGGVVTTTAPINAALLTQRFLPSSYVLLTNYHYMIDSSIILNSGNTLVLNNATLELDSGSHVNILINAAVAGSTIIAGGNADIHVKGYGKSVIKGSKENWGGYPATAVGSKSWKAFNVEFANVKNVSIEDITLKDNNSLAMNFEQSRFLYFHHIHVSEDSSHQNQDGIDFRFGTHDVIVDGMDGTNEDDKIAITNILLGHDSIGILGHKNYEAYRTDSDEYNYIIRNIDADSMGAFPTGVYPTPFYHGGIGVYAADGYKIHDVSFNGINQFTQIQIGFPGLAINTTPIYTDISNVEITDANKTRINIYYPIYGSSFLNVSSTDALGNANCVLPNGSARIQRKFWNNNPEYYDSVSATNAWQFEQAGSNAIEGFWVNQKSGTGLADYALNNAVNGTAAQFRLYGTGTGIGLDNTAGILSSNGVAILSDENVSTGGLHNIKLITRGYGNSAAFEVFGNGNSGFLGTTDSTTGNVNIKQSVASGTVALSIINSSTTGSQSALILGNSAENASIFKAGLGYPGYHGAATHDLVEYMSGTAGNYYWISDVTGSKMAWIVNGATSAQMSLTSTGLQLTSLTASQIVGTDGSSNLKSIGTTGQTTLVAGTKAISITGVTSTSKVQVTCASQGGTTTTTATYTGVCTSGTLTINAVTSAGTNTVNTGDTSTVNYTVTF